MAEGLFGNFTANEIADDCVLPCQLPRHRECPDAGLFVAVLVSAIDDLRHSTHCFSPRSCNRCRRQYDAELWVSGATALLSFVEVCNGLDLNPDSVRRGLAQEHVTGVKLRLHPVARPFGIGKREFGETADEVSPG
jgi:hypothetical protein